MSDFVNITSADRWFKQHPEKIAGVEFESTSFMFPIQVKGDRGDVERVINATLNKQVSAGSGTTKLKVAKAKAKALKLQLLVQ